MTDRSSVVEIENRRLTVMEGLYEWRNPKNGFLVNELEFRVMPEKRSEEAIRQSQAGIPKKEWEREFGSSWNVFIGKPVYSDYDEGVHLAHGPIIAPRKAKLISGWDSGPNDLNSAWVLGIVFPGTPSVLWIDEYTIDNGDTRSFVEVCASRLKLEWAKLGGFSVHVCDPSVFTESRIDEGKTVAFLMRKFGLFPTPGEVAFTRRRDIVTDMMVKAVTFERGNMIPRWRVHERCTFLRAAMSGGYQYPKRPGTQAAGAYNPQPLKNEYSHIANAMEYACSRIAMMENGIPYEGRKLPVRNRI